MKHLGASGNPEAPNNQLLHLLTTDYYYLAEEYLKFRITDLSVNSGSDIAAFGGGDGERFVMKLGSP